MHDYLRAIGFSSVQSKAEFEKFLKKVEEEPKLDLITDDGIRPALGEKSIEIAENIGITVRGEYDEDGNFFRDYYFPYFKGTEATLNEVVDVEKHSDRCSFVGITDYQEIGVSLIFHLLNMVDYVEYISYAYRDHTSRDISLSALSISGKVLLPLLKTEATLKRDRMKLKDRKSKISAAKNGDQEALDSLTLEDLDLFTMAIRRTQTEDVLSIVETSFMPYGIACDQYSILGTIQDVSQAVNEYTGEKLYILKLECNHLFFDVCINAKDLYGEPLPGRRFKGCIWLQGSVSYNADGQ